MIVDRNTARRVGSAKHVVWSLPSEGSSTVGIAEKTALYPSLFFEGTRTSWINRGRSDPEIFRYCKKQILVVTDTPGPRHRELLISASNAGCPSVVLLWCDAPWPAAAEILHGVDPALVVVADPWRTEQSQVQAYHVFPIPILPARVIENSIINRLYPILAPSQHWGDGHLTTPVSSCVICIVSGARDLELIAPALQRAASRDKIYFVIVAPNPGAIAHVITDFELPAQMIAEEDESWLELLNLKPAAVICAAGLESSSSLKGAIWALTALRAGVPLITNSHPLLEPFFGSIILDDWERGLALYTSESIWFRGVDRAIGLAKARTFASLSEATTAWQPLLSGSGLPPSNGNLLAATKPVLVVLFDLAQDLDVLLPILRAIQELGRLDCHCLVTEWLEQESPRTLTVLKHEGFPFQRISRDLIRAEGVSWPPRARALLTGSESNVDAHRVGHALTRVANDAGFATFTVQHGFENIGLTYKDAVHGPDVVFASQYIFTWCAVDKLPDWLCESTRSRVVPVGLTKPTPTPIKIPIRGRWTAIIGIFENLHWHRYSDAYKRDLREQLVAVAQRFPNILFFIKPHHAGRWMSSHPDFLPQQGNIVLADPHDPKWEPYTAPSLLFNLDAVITTPSTVVVDAARAGRPVAVIGNDLFLPMYEPLPILREVDDWARFLENLDDLQSVSLNNDVFLRRHLLPSGGHFRVADQIENVVRNMEGFYGTRRELFSR